MEALHPTIVHSDVLAICVEGDIIYAGVGGRIFMYKNDVLISEKLLFQSQKVHCITSGTEPNKVLVAGGKEIALCNVGSDIKLTNLVICDDWILDIKAKNSKEFLVVTAHNQVQLWCGQKVVVKSKSSPQERPLLYCAKIFLIKEKDLVILAGTNYSNVIIWRPCFSEPKSVEIICCLTGHSGVIFSISVKEYSSDTILICTTSDDRSVRLWHVKGSWESKSIACISPMFSHSSRVWKSLLLDHVIVSVGEDSAICLWNYQGQLCSKMSLQKGGGIRGLDFDKTSYSLIFGGGNGQILKIPLKLFDEFSIKEADELRVEFKPKELPRKVVYSPCFGPVCLTSLGRMVTDDACLGFSNDYKKANDLKTSTRGHIIAICNRLESLFILDEHKEMHRLMMLTNDVCLNILWRDNYVLVHFEKEVLELSFINDSVGLFHKGSYALPKKKKDNTPVCFLFVPDAETGKLLVGDRQGAIHFYEACPSNAYTMKLHGTQGVFDIFLWKNKGTILTAGAGGFIRELKIDKNKLELVRSYKIPMETAVKIIPTTLGIIILGFHSNDVQIWHLQESLLLGTYNCGGCHRSYDFRLQNTSLDFLFIKEKDIKVVTFQLYCPKVLRNRFHNKTINSLEVVVSDIFVSGGEDNTLHFFQFNKEDIKTLFISEKHFSSIRAIAVSKMSPVEYLITSVGGREQLVLTTFNSSTKDVCEIHFQQARVEERHSDARYMCLAMENLRDKILILVGCSDCTVKIFVYKKRLMFIDSLIYTYCILKVAIIQVKNEIFALAFCTDGEVVFWSITAILTGEECIQPNPTCSFKLHNSGINSVAIGHYRESDFFLATGGDDNKLSVMIIRYDGSTWAVLSVWSNSYLHSCQITGLIFYKNFLITTGIDQLIIILKVDVELNFPVLSKIKDYQSSTPDIHGITLFEENKKPSLIVYGKGIEVFQPFK